MVNHISNKLRVNRQIRAREVRVIDSEGNQVDIMSLKNALNLAKEKNLDLVEVNPGSRPPVCKLLDYGKYRYEQSKKERMARQNRNIISLKEVKFRPKIDSHDYETKKRMVLRLLKGGDKVKVTLMFRGREVVYKRQGIDRMNQLAEEIKDQAVIERRAKAEGRNITMILAPKPQ